MVYVYPHFTRGGFRTPPTIRRPLTISRPAVADRSPLIDRLLSWSIATRSDFPPELISPPSLPDTFDSATSYIAAFEPLFLIECWAQIWQAKDDSESRPVKFEIKRTSVDGLWMTVTGTHPPSKPINKGDLVWVRQDDVDTLAFVEEHQRVSSENKFLLVLRCRSNSAISMYGDSEPTIKGLFNTTPVWREYEALVAIRGSPLSADVFSASLIKPVAWPANAVRSSMDAHALNEPQASAVLSSIRGKGISLIQGPPGTGKTTTILALISRLRKPRTPILVCAPSNAAVDEIATRLLSGVRNAKGNVTRPTVVRIGDSTAITSKLLPHFINNLVNDKLHGHTRITSSDRQQTRLDILQKADVVCATLSSAGQLRNQIKFKTVIIDEACQATEVATLIPLTLECEKAILIGGKDFQATFFVHRLLSHSKTDTKQLPPTVISQTASDLLYVRSLFERLAEQSRPDDISLLSIQYRMHPHISAFPSKTFYGGRLRDGGDMASKTRRDWHTGGIFSPYSMTHVEGATEARSGTSWKNPLEAITAADFDALLETEHPRSANFQYSIGIITPYKAQVSELTKVFCARFGKAVLNSVTIDTVDAFQGQEKDIIIFSCVRGGPENQNLGFLRDTRRMNVALTRAKSTLLILGDSEKLKSDVTWGKLVDDAQKRGMFMRLEPSEPSLEVEFGNEESGEEELELPALLRSLAI